MGKGGEKVDGGCDDLEIQDLRSVVKSQSDWTKWTKLNWDWTGLIGLV